MQFQSNFHMGLIDFQTKNLTWPSWELQPVKLNLDQSETCNDKPWA